jgi:hypothetical protein
MPEELTNPEPDGRQECRGGGWCALCRSFQRILKFICALPNDLTLKWDTWREIFILGSAMLLMSGIALLDGYVFFYNPNGTKDIPDSLKNLLTLLTGYLFAYIPTSLAASSAEKSRRESDSRLQEVLGVLNNQLIPAINGLREEVADVTAAVRGELRENITYQEGEEELQQENSGGGQDVS